ncbi:hypothetical protein Cadr_000002828 [Camelus dromedarius]|uniref:Uncharacterized protein n=1 Tax=Camelus dromedarius TaxID=9838 RepID=A0A5N4C3V2_CAMDR|nr:hypothetical protein Cadr_000002828 [Camelus dromedarius]
MLGPRKRGKLETMLHGITALLQLAFRNKSELGSWAFGDQCRPPLQKHFIPFLYHSRLRLSPKRNLLTFHWGIREYEDKYVTGSADEIIPSERQ